MRVAVVSTFYPNSAEPGRAVFVRNLVAALEHYVPITVVSPVPYAPRLPGMPRWQSLRAIPRRVSEQSREIFHPRYVAIPKCAPLNGVTYFLGVIGILRRLVRSQRINLIHAHCAFPDAVGVALAASRLQIPFVVTAHGSDINVYSERRLIRNQIVWAFEQASAVIAVSQALQRKIRALAPEVTPKVVHIPCAGINPSVFMLRDRDAARSGLGYMHKGRIILFVGQLVPVKAVNVLISAWQIMLAHGKARRDDLLVIAGDGPERSSLEALVATQNLKDAVLFLGDISQESVSAWMSAATALCLPSRNEGTPNVLIEALASGRPVIASRVGGVPEVVSEGQNGLLVQPGDDIALSEALATAFDREWDSAEIAGGISDCTWSMLARRNIEVFRDVLQNRNVDSPCLQ